MTELKTPLHRDALRQQVAMALLTHQFEIKQYISRIAVLYAVQTADLLADALDMTKDELTMAIHENYVAVDARKNNTGVKA